jgi:hypothetical protein
MTKGEMELYCGMWMGRYSRLDYNNVFFRVPNGLCYPIFVQPPYKFISKASKIKYNLNNLVK